MIGGQKIIEKCGQIKRHETPLILKFIVSLAKTSKLIKSSGIQSIEFLPKKLRVRKESFIEKNILSMSMINSG
jgi:hypothetical protein